MDDKPLKDNLLKFLESIDDNDLLQGSSKELGPETAAATEVNKKSLPMINPRIIPEVTHRLCNMSKDLDKTVHWLEAEMSTISHRTHEFVCLHSTAVDDVSTHCDDTVKAMYSLISKSSAVQKDLMKIEMMSSHLKAINKYLERLDNTLSSTKPA